MSNVDPSLWSRCLELGVLAWHCSAEGVIEGQAEGAGELKAVFDSDVWRRVLRQAIAPLVAGGDEQTLEVFEDWRLVALGEYAGLRRAGWTLALVLGPKAKEAEGLRRLCAETGVDWALAAEAVERFAAADEGQVRRTLAALRWSQQDLARQQADRHTLEEFSQKLAQSYEETNLLFGLARFMNCVSDPGQLVQLLCNRLHQVLPFGWLAIRFKAGGLAVPDLAGRLVLAGHLPCPAGTFAEEAGRFAEQWSNDPVTRVLGREHGGLAALSKSDVLAEPITHDGHLIGVVLAGNKLGTEPEVTSGEIRFVNAASNFLGIFHENILRFTEQHTLFMGTLQALTASVDAKDPYTRGHSERVGYLAEQLAGALGFDKKQVEQYHIAGLLHDIGKIGVAEAVLCKPGKLTAEEFAQIKRHPEVGFRILKDIPALVEVLPGVLHHHERFDGKGYPAGLAGESIPLIARALALADTFDAMSSNRAYRPALAREQVMAEIQRCAGGQFDAKLTEVFLGLDFGGFDQLLQRHQSQASRAA